MRFLFRVDASLAMGSGHVMRCLTLAKALRERGHLCLFVCRDHPGHLNFIVRNHFDVHSLPMGNSQGGDLDHAHWLGASQSEDAELCRPVIERFRPDWLVVDHYALDARWELELKPHYGRLMVIDDLADRLHQCDLLLDQTFGRDAKDYRPWVPTDCRLLCGSQYALLRPEFSALRCYSLQRRSTPELRRLLITLGGVDKDNATGQVLEALRACPLPAECQVTIVMGATAPWLGEVERTAQGLPWPTQVKVGVSDMAQLMADNDLAIGAAGSTSWELCCLGVPSLLLCTAANQSTVIAALASAGATATLDRASLNQPDGVPFRAQYANLVNNLEMYTAAAARVTDGVGASRVCAQLR